jgi:hypothetical protein
MTDLLPANFPATYLLPLLLVVLLLIWLVIRWRKAHPRSLAHALDTIAFERIDDLVIPNADEGEIQIHHLVLTAKGLLVIDVKDVQGAVFGSDKMQEWTVISEDRRFTFSNPQHALYDRIAAVRQIVREVPVAGRILSMVTTLDEIMEEFGESDKAAAKIKIEAFMPHWDLIHSTAEVLVTGRLSRKRPQI